RSAIPPDRSFAQPFISPVLGCPINGRVPAPKVHVAIPLRLDGSQFRQLNQNLMTVKAVPPRSL
ncbi:MAG TPA: hypothetical protein VGI28_03930, partial [Stellaceae bacterium]